MVDVLFAVQNLIQNALSRHGSDGVSELPSTTPVETAEVRGLAIQLARQSTTDLLWAIPVRHLGPWETERVLDAVRTAAAARTRVRLLCPAADLGDDAASRFLTAAGACAEVRVGSSPLPELILCDGRVGLLGGTGDVTRLLRGPDAIGVVEQIADSAWNVAVPHYELEKLAAELTRRVLDHLVEGYTDEVAARKLGISVRTFRRHVSQITRELGASSRFQAGVRVGRLGLLEPSVARAR